LTGESGVMTRLSAILLALLVVTGGALAASPEADYFATRDKALAEIKALEDAKASESAIQAAEDKATAKLVNQLKAIIGPVAIKGFASPDQLNIALTQHQEGYGDLDGLTTDRGLVVTTRPLLRAWLEASSKDEGAKRASPTDVGAAAREEAFYTGSLYSDETFEKYADLPVMKPARADLVVAVLGGLSQGFPGELPDVVVATVLIGDRVFIAGVHAKAPIGKIAACEPIWAKGQRKQAETDDPIEKNYRACFRASAAKQSFFADVTKEAQSLVDRLAGN
jgi:hypothetical protein